MDFKDLGRKSEPVEPSELRDGETYFLIHYLDRDLLVPILRPVVYIGLLEAKTRDVFHFQDAVSYLKGIRYGDPDTREALPQDVLPSDSALFFTISGVPAVYLLEKGIEELARCAQRRRKASK